jgi:hypothetical protein
MWNVTTGREMVQIANRAGVLLGNDGNTLAMINTSDLVETQKPRPPELILLPTFEEIDMRDPVDADP